MVKDIQADAIGSFERADAAAHPGLRVHADLAILLEAVAENPDFAPTVATELEALDPEAGARVRIVAAPGPGPAPGTARGRAARLGPGRGGSTSWRRWRGPGTGPGLSTPRRRSTACV